MPSDPSFTANRLRLPGEDDPDAVPELKELDAPLPDYVPPVMQSPDRADDVRTPLSFAQGQIGRRYAGPVIGEPDAMRWGGPKENGWDCSSLVSAAWAHSSKGGVDLTPFTDEINNQSYEISEQDAKPGDIIMYQYADRGQKDVKYPHVGMYAGPGMMLDAQPEGGVQNRPMLNLPYTIRRPAK